MIYELGSIQVPSISQVGGKAKALIETSGQGLPVPEGMVLSVDFFSHWLLDIKGSQDFRQMLETMTKEACDKVKKKAQSLIFDSEMNELFDARMAEISGNIFAVRSSSPEEDLEGTSFAGMYETYLGQNRGDLKGIVAQTFASCFDYRVMSYKKDKGMSLEDTSIAIIIQKQIASEVSGVGFSLNPLNNAYDEVFINSSFGLGEAIVSGIVTPDTFVYDVVEKKVIDEKKLILRRLPYGLTMMVALLKKR